MNMEWETVIGLEVHAQLLTRSKAFSGASTKYGAEPNTQACAVDIALPGVLPVFNKEAARMAVELGLGIRAQELFLSRPAQGLPDQPVRAADRSQGPYHHRRRRRGEGHWRHARASGGRRRQILARGFSRHDRHRSQPRRHAVARDRLRTGPAPTEGSRGLSQETARTRALPRDLRGQHAGG